MYLQLDLNSHLYRLRLKPPKFSAILDVFSWWKLSPQAIDWQFNVNTRNEEGDYLKSAHEPKLIKIQFGISHPTHFFSVWNFKLGFLYLNFPKIDCDILVKFAYSLKLSNSLHIISRQGRRILFTPLITYAPASLLLEKIPFLKKTFWEEIRNHEKVYSSLQKFLKTVPDVCCQLFSVTDTNQK